MKKIFFFARDPGGVNALIPIILNTDRNLKIVVYGKDGAMERFSQNGVVCEDIMRHCIEISISEIEYLLQVLMPDLIITGTSSDDFTEKYLWTAARNMKIKSFAVIDSWVNYGIRFSKYTLKESEKYWSERDFSYLPNFILTMDDYSKKEMIKDGIPEEKIVVTGQPYLEYTRKRILQVEDEKVKAYRKKVGCLNDEKLIVYASDNIYRDFDDKEGKTYWGYNERTIFPYVYDALMNVEPNSNEFVLLVRPHPKEDISYWEGIALENKRLRMIIDASTTGDLIIRAADLIISMQSMFLMEAALVGKKIMSVQIGLQREDPLILSKLDIVKPVMDDKNLQLKLHNFFTKKSEKSIMWHVSGNAIENINCLIKETLWQN